MTSVSHQRHESFARTRWSIVTRVAAPARRAPRDAFAELCFGYWYPVYAYVRRSGHAPTIAQDIARSFLSDLLRRFREEAQPLPTEHFRRFLLASLNRFLAGDWRDCEDDPAFEPALPTEDIESRYRRDCLRTASPEQAFQRCFALEVLARAARRLADEAQQTGHADMYATLAPFLVRDPAAGQYEEIALQLRTRALAVVVALKRLRQRFRELAGEELTDTVTSTDELATEQQTLYAVLQENQ